MFNPARDAAHAADAMLPVSELAFIDTALPDWPALQAGLPNHVIVVWLDPLADGLATMADAASQYRDLAAIHVFSHGFEGGLVLGSCVLDTQALPGRAADLAMLGASLTAGGDILLYGCNVAAGQGSEFLTAFAEAAGADVAASRTPTGAAALGGDWVLHWTHGEILARQVAVPEWRGLMQTSVTLNAQMQWRDSSESGPIGIIFHDVNVTSEESISGLVLEVYGLQPGVPSNQGDMWVVQHQIPLAADTDGVATLGGGYAFNYSLVREGGDGGHATLTLRFDPPFTPDIVSQVLETIQFSLAGVDPGYASGLVETRAVILRSLIEEDEDVIPVNAIATVSLANGGFGGINGPTLAAVPQQPMATLVPGQTTELVFDVEVPTPIMFATSGQDAMRLTVSGLPPSWGEPLVVTSMTGSGSSQLSGVVYAGPHTITVYITPPADAEAASLPLSLNLSGIAAGFGSAPLSLNSGAILLNLDAAPPAAPELESATVDGAVLVLTFDMVLDEANGPSEDDFAVEVNGVALSVTDVQVDSAARTVTLTLDSPVPAGATVSVSYTDPSPGDDPAAIQGVDGTDAASFSGQAVVNNTASDGNTPPSVTLTPENSVYRPVYEPIVADLFEDVTAQTLDAGQVFTGLELTVHYAGPGDKLVIGSEEIALVAGSGTFSAGAYEISRENGVYTVGLSGMSLSDAAMAALIDGLALSLGNPFGGPETSFTRVAVLRSVTDSGSDENVTRVDQAASVTLSRDTVNANLITIRPDGGPLELAAGDTVQVSFTVNIPSTINLPNTTVSFYPEVPAAWTVGNLVFNGVPGGGLGRAPLSPGEYTLTFDVTVPPNAVLGASPIVVDAGISGGIDTSVPAISSGVAMATVLPSPPQLESATVIDDTLILTFDVVLDEDNGPSAADFTVTVDGTQVSITSVAVDATAQTVTLTLSQPVIAGNVVTVSYTDPTPGDDANAVQSALGQDAASFADQAVTNLSGLTLDRIIDNVGNRVGYLADGDTTDDTRLALTGKGEAGKVVEVHDGDTLLGTATVAANGYWLFHTDWLTNGEPYAFRAKYAEDPGGISYTDSHAITVNAPYPLAPTTAEYGGNSVGTYENNTAFAAIKTDGTVVTWGSTNPSASVSAQLTDVVQIFSNAHAFAALTANGKVVTWGGGSNGGNSGSVAGQLGSGVKQVFSTERAFAALKENGSVVAWGQMTHGGSPSTAIKNQLTDVAQIFSTQMAFAALTHTGKVVAWGDGAVGGQLGAVAGQLASGVKQVFSSQLAFAALKENGSVVTWGGVGGGGNSSGVAAQLTSDVVQVFGAQYAFAALKEDGSVVTWGDDRYGGANNTEADLTSGVVQVFSSQRAFAALKADGSVVTWGDAGYGGSNNTGADLRSGVVQIFGNDVAFAALKEDGTVVTWGGGPSGNSTSVAEQLTGVVQVFSNNGAFAALKADGSVVTWGSDGSGGNSNAVAEQLTGVVQIIGNGHAFAAIKEDGTVVIWGQAGNGGTNNTGADLTDIASISDPRGSTTVLLDTLPYAPTVTLAEDTGSDPADGITADATLLVNGLADGATWEYSVDNGVNWQTGSGNSFELDPGSYAAGQIAVRQTVDGKTSAVGSNGAPIVIDQTAPTASPDVTLPAGGPTQDNTITVELDGIDDGDGWQYSLDGGQTWSTGDATGTATVPDGSYPAGQILVRLVDAAGNAGPSVPSTQAVTIDTTSPGIPSITTPALTRDALPTISGKAEANSTVVISIGGATYTVQADGDGDWSVDLATATPASGALALNSNGNNSVSVTATDAAGNTSGAAAQTLVIDTTAPAVPTITSDALTNEAVPELTGTAEANSTVTVTVGGATYTVQANADGDWVVDLATATPDVGTGPLALNSNGNNPVSVTATDAAGNVSLPGTQALTIDTTAPAAPTITSDALTNEAAPELTGTAEAGSTVTITVGGATYTTTATGGVWNLDLATATPASGTLSLNTNGNNPVSVTAADAAGNVSLAGTQTLTIDTTAPAAPTITSDALTNEAAPELTGIAEANSTVTVTVAGATYTVTAASNGTWRVDLATATPASGTLSLNTNGNNPVSVTATDAAGNVSLPGTQALTIDTTAPAAPTITSDALTNEAAPELTGTAEANSTVTITVAGATYEVVATAAGTWSVDLATATPASGTLALNTNGNNPVSATATDAAGNVSLPGTQSLVIDTTAPAAPTITSDALTNEAAPELTGIAEANSTVTVTVAGATYTVTAASNGTWRVDLDTATPASGTLSLNTNGNNPVSVTAMDAAGNVSLPGTQALTIDTTAPAAPTITSDALTNEAAPELTGTAEAGSTVTITVGGATYTITATGGVWNLDLATATPTSGTLALNTNGSNPVSVTATDAAGNTSSAAAQTLVIDTIAPFVPTITSDALTNDTTPELAGTAEANSTVTVTVAGATYTLAAGADGTWRVDLATATPASGTLSLNTNGNNPVSVTATDAAGNVSLPGTQALTIDTTAPAAPTITSAALTNEAAPELTGIAEANSTVTVTVAGATYEVVATAAGTWSLDLANATPTSGLLSLNTNGNNPVSVTATDAAGNVSDPGTQALTIDTTAPAVPTITSAALTNDAAPELAGTAEAGSTVTITIGGATYTTTAAAGGVWTLNLETATPIQGALSVDRDGDNPVNVTATDAAGNVSSPATQILQIDTTAPAVPTITSDDVTNDTTPELVGTAEANSTVTITVAGATYTVTAGSDGTWRVDLETATPTSGTLSLNTNGNNPVSATARDAAGNVSNPGTQVLQIDTTAPATPTITSPALTNDTTPELAGTAEANSTVTITVGGATYTTIATGGTWRVDLETATPNSGTLSLNTNGNNPVSATARDAAGNVSLPATQALTIDTTAPAAPTITSDDITNDTTPELAGTAEANSTVTVTVAGATYTVTAGSDGTWRVDLATATPASGTLSLNTNGDNAVSVTSTDAAGNVSLPATQALTIDTTAPAAPTITSDDITNDTTPELAGTAEANSTVTVTVAGATYTVTAGSDGTWRVDLATATPASGTLALNANGDNLVSVTATDAAGNNSSAAEQTLVIDTTAPAVPTITSDALSNDAAPELTGTAEAGSTVIVNVAGATYTVQADALGDWSVDLATATPDVGTGPLALNDNGSNSVSVTAADAAGNTSGAVEQTLVIDTTAPAVPTITSDALTNETAPELTGAAEAGSTVTVTVGNATYTVQADADGDWFVDLATATPDVGTGPLALNDNGSNPVSVTATDAAGNTSGAVEQTLIIDTTAPAVPTITSDALTNEAAPELTGTAEANSTVTVTVAGATYTVQADADGDWRLDLETATPASGTLALDGNGNNPVSVTATDAAGNTSSAAAQTLVIDTTAPVVPTITSPALTNETAPELMGSAEANSTVTVTVAGATYTVQANADGDWRLDLETATPASGTLTLNDNGSNAVSVTATDAAGNTSTAAEQTLVIDTTPPAAPTGVTLPAGGPSHENTVTVDLDSLEVEATWQYSLDGGTTWETGDGNRFTVPDGNYLAGAIQVRQIDAAGNPGAPVGTSRPVTIDTTPPTAPTLSFASDASTWVVTVANLEPGATWQYQIDGGDWVTGQGESFTLPLGAYPAGAIQVRQIDAAGNLGAALGSAALTPPATDLDGDGLDDNIENGVPGMEGGQQGDGNGDGIPDAEQSDVTSLIWVQTPDEQVRYVTLVNNAGLVQQAVSTAPIDAATLPEALTLPLGTLTFTVRDLPESGIVTFSVFIDDDIPVNGYWKQIDGQWINIATAIEAVGGKIRIDFQIEDGGPLDADGVRNGVIVDPGAPGWFDGDPYDTDGDQFPDLLEPGVGLTPGVKDNDVFARDDFFVMQVYRDALGREAEAGGLHYWVDELAGGLTREAFLTHVWTSDEARDTVPLAHLAVGLLVRSPEAAEWAAWRDGLAQGQSAQALTDAFVLTHYDQAADAAFVDQLYADALSREADAGGRAYWLDLLAEGSSRGQVALGIVHSEEARLAHADTLDVTLLYTGLLGRQTDAQGLAYWSGTLADGADIAQVAIGIMGSTEYHDRFLPSQEDTTGG